MFYTLRCILLLNLRLSLHACAHVVLLFQSGRRRRSFISNLIAVTYGLMMMGLFNVDVWQQRPLSTTDLAMADLLSSNSFLVFRNVLSSTDISKFHRFSFSQAIHFCPLSYPSLYVQASKSWLRPLQR